MMSEFDKALEASEWKAWADYSLAKPRPDPEENCQVFRRRHTYESGIAEGLRRAQPEAERYAECKRLLLAAQRLYQDQAKELSAAQQEAEAWEAIRVWCLAKPGRYTKYAPHVPYLALTDHGIEQYESEVEVDGENVLTKAATWCRRELS